MGKHSSEQSHSSVTRIIVFGGLALEYRFRALESFM